MRKLIVLLGSLGFVVAPFVAFAPAARANTCTANVPFGEEVCNVVLTAEGAVCKSAKIPCPR